jgi:hypothetical protein
MGTGMEFGRIGKEAPPANVPHFTSAFAWVCVGYQVVIVVCAYLTTELHPRCMSSRAPFSIVFMNTFRLKISVSGYVSGRVLSPLSIQLSIGTSSLGPF